jgi:hypothetical protein
MFALSGCVDSPTSESRPRLSTHASPVFGAAPPDQDEALTKIADVVPGFAGFYVRAGTLVLRAKSKIVGDTTLQRLRTALLASDATTSFGDLKRLLQQPSALVESSPYDARELWEFKVRARHLFSSSVHKLDIDESLGLLRLSVSDPNAAAVARIRARQAGVPDAAVVFDVAPTARSTADLDDRFRPVPGGVRIDPYGGTYCTIGLNALTSGGWAFLTAAHCSGTFGSVDGLEMLPRSTGLGQPHRL